MNENQSSPIHPGLFFREHYLNPRNLTVTKAAEIIGISRPNLSNFLNGKISTSPEMAAKLEAAFGVPAEKLLELQTSFNMARLSLQAVTSETRPYVPPFLKILAKDIVTWSDTISSRTHLPVLLRTLVHSTGKGLQKVDFPGNDDGERRGSDGIIVAEGCTPWIPAGTSTWELGTKKDFKTKAEEDFQKSINAFRHKSPENVTFVFVTTRRWLGKDAWVEEKQKLKLWRDVRAYDASDLEQWIEQSPSAQVWFSEETSRPSENIRTLERCWHDWADSTNPELDSSLFDQAKETWKQKIETFLSDPDNKSLKVSADSIEEALAFLHQSISFSSFQEAADKTLVFDKTGTLPRLAQANLDFIAVTYHKEVELEVAPFSSKLKHIGIYTKNAVHTKADIILHPLTSGRLSKSLKKMGIEEDEIKRLEKKSGHSLTVLRRQLSPNIALRYPQWAREINPSSPIIPLTLIGVWCTEDENDKRLLTKLCKSSYEELEKQIRAYMFLSDSPIWSIGEYQGMVSVFDALFAIAPFITKSELFNFLDVAFEVLSEDDPSLDLPVDKRWLASSHGKTRHCSSAMRKSIAESLILISVYGNELFSHLAYFDAEFEVAKIICKILNPLTLRKLEAQADCLSYYAEAAPRAFIKIIKDDLEQEKPAVFELFKPRPITLFSPCYSSGLLSALEILAWNPDIFPTIIQLLAKLSVSVMGNGSSSPLHSLCSILKPWMPQTSADLKLRVSTIRRLFKDNPEAAWKVFCQLIEYLHQEVGNFTRKPLWRTDAVGYGNPLEDIIPANNFRRHLIDLALSQSSYNSQMFCDLIWRLPRFSEEQQSNFWSVLDKWVKEKPTQDELAKVREEIRLRFFNSHGFVHRIHDVGFSYSKEQARIFYKKLQPTDIYQKHMWLFNFGLVDISSESDKPEEWDLLDQGEKLLQFRVEALSEITSCYGLEGIFHFAKIAKCQSLIGEIAIKSVVKSEELEDFFIYCLKNQEFLELARGASYNFNDDQKCSLFKRIAPKIEETLAVDLLLLFPYRQKTWNLLNSLSDKASDRYWKNVSCLPLLKTQEEAVESINKLISVKRAKAAFLSVQFQLQKIDTKVLLKIMRAMLEEEVGTLNEGPLVPDNVVEALALISSDSTIPLEERAILEFQYIEFLTKLPRWQKEPQLPSLEQYVWAHPEIFVEAVVGVFKRKHGGEDPPEIMQRPKNPNIARKYYLLLEHLHGVPEKNNGKRNLLYQYLMGWISTIREQSRTLDRIGVTDEKLGELFASALLYQSSDIKTTLLDIMEELHSEKISIGVRTGLFNSRGVYSREPGGIQERELAERYQYQGELIKESYPFVADSVYMTLSREYQKDAVWEAERDKIEDRIGLIYL
ncbi:HigA family addiction module antitoxin [uncultured Turicimonas sp.]|uniref:HigA family addiction module antitoxin n=1 Tax=uncultured Turicimonas sp. TaxID=1918607 RepID=UPI002803EDF0|nr:HigA family addiction module antitoxin [uncultured Turicimonas sp.]